MDTTLDMQRIFRIRNTYFTVFVVEQDTRRVEHQIFCLFGISQGTDLEYGTSAGDVGANHITITRRCTLKKKFLVVKESWAAADPGRHLGAQGLPKQVQPVRARPGGPQAGER